MISTESRPPSLEVLTKTMGPQKNFKSVTDLGLKGYLHISPVVLAFNNKDLGFFQNNFQKMIFILKKIFKDNKIKLEVEKLSTQLFKDEKTKIPEILKSIIPKKSNMNTLRVSFFESKVRELDGLPDGFSFGLPGPFNIEGSFPRGVTVKAFYPDTNAKGGLFMEHDRVAETAAHEIGHYLGLFHVCEGFRADSLEDPFPDTVCQKENLMSMGDHISNRKLSPSQIEVLLRHPKVTLY